MLRQKCRQSQSLRYALHVTMSASLTPAQLFWRNDALLFAEETNGGKTISS